MKLERYLEKFKHPKNRVHTPEQALAETIWLSFGKKLPFARIMRMIKLKGHQAIYECFNEVKHSDAKDRLALFLCKSKNEKVIWNEIK